MKTEYLEQIDEILRSSTSIKLHTERIYQLRLQLEDLLSDEEKFLLSSNIKTRVQQEAEQSFYSAGEWGAVYAATGTGKSKIAVDVSDRLVKNVSTARVLISVPTERLRDTGWSEEYSKWGKSALWDSNIERCCYASLSKYENEEFDLLVLDEGHNITDLNSTFFEKNKVKRCLLLTATKPKDLVKQEILKDLKIGAVFELSLDESVQLGLVAPYDITVITTTLDNTVKYIKAGSKAKSWLNTEKAQYGYLSARLAAAPNQMGFIERMQFIYNLRSKTEQAAKILEHVIPKDLKTLIFCGSKEQANQLCDHRYYSKPTPPKKLTKITPAKLAKYDEQMLKYKEAMKEYQGYESLEKFINDQIKRLTCVNALNEGHNIPSVDVAFIIQLNRNEKDLIQRTGRIIRYRPGHIGKVIILCVSDTVDKDWVKQSLENLDSGKIKYVELSHLRMGIETISFD